MSARSFLSILSVIFIPLGCEQPDSPDASKNVILESNTAIDLGVGEDADAHSNGHDVHDDVSAEALSLDPNESIRGELELGLEFVLRDNAQEDWGTERTIRGSCISNYGEPSTVEGSDVQLEYSCRVLPNNGWCVSGRLHRGESEWTVYDWQCTHGLDSTLMMSTAEETVRFQFGASKISEF